MASPSQAGSLDVSVIIVNYNVRAFLRQALRSVQRSLQGIPAEVFVVDNDSEDGSCNMVRQEFPEVQLIANEDNVGFAKANNQAIGRARGRYLLILNPDTVVQRCTVQKLAAFLDAYPDAGAAGCQILNPDGSFAPESRRAFPTPSVAFFRATGLSRLFPRSQLFGQYNLGHLPQDQVNEVDALSGSCMMVRRSAIDYSREAYADLSADEKQTAATPLTPRAPSGGGAGIFDEQFFMYGEDLDWCYRLQQAGWKIYYTPDTSIVHYKGESTKKGQLRYVRLFYGAMLRFAEKHFSHRYPPFLVWFLQAAVIARGTLAAILQGLRHRATHDAILVFAVMALLGLLRSAQLGVQFPDMFYWLIAPAFAVTSVLIIGILGGYRGRRHRMRAVMGSIALSVLILSTASFFVKSIAYSRAVVLASLPTSVAALALLRMPWTVRARGAVRTLFVGPAAEAQGLYGAQQSRSAPRHNVIGYVSPDFSPNGTDAPPYLGTSGQLRSLVQAHRVQSVVFDSKSLSNDQIFTMLQHLSGLGIGTKVLAHNHAHTFDRTSVDLDRGSALLDAREVVGRVRGATARRLFEIAIALLGLCAHPFVLLAARMRRSVPCWGTLAGRTRQWPAVLTGRRAVVGFHEDAPYAPPTEWALRRGVFAVTESLGSDPTDEEAARIYWSYVRRQSAAVDWQVMVRAIRLLP